MVIWQRVDSAGYSLGDWSYRLYLLDSSISRGSTGRMKGTYSFLGQILSGCNYFLNRLKKIQFDIFSL